VRPAFKHRRQASDPLKTVIAFDAGESRCDDGRITQWQWDFGDGATGDGPEVTHAYTEPGRYTVTLRLGTDRGGGARLRQTIQINPAWVEGVRTGGGIWLEAEEFSGEGAGASRIVDGRVNASSRIVTYWDTELGHWLEWKIPIHTAGAYAVALRYASAARQAVRDCQINGASPGEEWLGLIFPGTGGYCTQTDNWAWRLLKGKSGDVLRLNLDAGEHTLRLINRGGGMALDAILIIPSGLLPPGP
jgi:hypothetical protein